MKHWISLAFSRLELKKKPQKLRASSAAEVEGLSLSVIISEEKKSKANGMVYRLNRIDSNRLVIYERLS